jgi:hypothetical protein
VATSCQDGVSSAEAAEVSRGFFLPLFFENEVELLLETLSSSSLSQNVGSDSPAYHVSSERRR